nr:RHS repeat protein [Flexivirga meconopsidis]
MAFNTSGALTSITDRNNNVTKFNYSGGQVNQIQSGADDWVQVTHNDDGTVATVTDWGGPGTVSSGTTPDGVRYSYDSSGRLTQIRQVPSHSVTPNPPSTVEASFTWTSGGDLASITDGDGNVTSFTYDSSHRVTKVSQGKGSDLADTRFQYFASWTDVADPNSDQSVQPSAAAHTIYDVNTSTKLVSKATDPLGHTQSATYTPFNDVASATNGVGGTSTNSYSSGVNGGHSVTQSTNPDRRHGQGLVRVREQCVQRDKLHRPARQRVSDDV